MREETSGSGWRGCHIRRHRRARHFSSIKISNTFKRLCQAELLPEAYFVQAIQAPPHIQMGWQVKKSLRLCGAGRVLIDGPTARGGGWVYEPRRIWILRTRPPCHPRRILRIIWQCIMLEICHTKKMSVPVPRGWNYNLWWSGEWLARPPLREFSADGCDTGASLSGALLTYSQLATARINDRNHQYAWFPLLSCAAAPLTTAFTLHACLASTNF